jgi:farnesyl diphosphate synthase
LPSFSGGAADIARSLDAYLAQVLEKQRQCGAPERLIAAASHALIGGGKRFRPFLLIASASLFGVSREAALPAAAAIECVHAYSLIHDDLPCMDNDEMRRGKPTVWKAFDEWTAILAGDALQTLAFEILSMPECHSEPAVRADLISLLARAGGATGMVGGQMLDLLAGTSAAPSRDIAHVMRLQAMKTGRLIEAACEMGAALGSADVRRRAALRGYGQHLGLAFQISDDLLDAEGSAEVAGKATGKDAAAGKATLVGALGVAQAREHLDKAIAEALVALEIFGSQSAPLAEAAIHMGKREA